MSATEIVAGARGVEGVRSLLTGAQSRRAVADEVSSMLAPGCSLESLRLHRTKFKPGRKLSAWYTVSVRCQDGGGSREHEIAVTWTPAEPAFDERELEQAIDGGSGAFRTLRRWQPALQMQVLASPFDPRFPALAWLSQPSSVTASRPPSHPASVVTLRYRPGQRHLLRHGESDSAVFVKLSKAQDAGRVARVAAALNGWLADSGASLRVLTPIEVLPDAEAALFRRAPGRPLTHTPAGLRRLGAAVRLLHGAPTELLGEGAPSFDREVTGAIRAAQHLQVLLPTVARSLQATLGRVREGAESFGDPPATAIHGDLKLAHVWQQGPLLTLIDVDRMRCDDPDLDLGKCLADIRWCCRVRGGNIPALQRAFVDGYVGSEATRLDRARLYEVIFVLKAAARRVSITDSGWADDVAALADEARLLMADMAGGARSTPTAIGAPS